MRSIGLCLVVGSLVLLACRPAPESLDDPLPRRIGVSFVDIDEPTEMIQRGVLQSARPETEKVRWNSAGNSPAKQRADLDEFFAEPVEVLLIQPADADVLRYAVERAADRDIPLVWIREPRTGPDSPTMGLVVVETDWATALRGLPGGGAEVVATRPEERAAVLSSARAACPGGDDCFALPPAAADPDPGTGTRLALDDEALKSLVTQADPESRPWAIASEACAQGLFAGSVGGCVDTRPFETGRSALDRARQALTASDAAREALSQQGSEAGPNLKSVSPDTPHPTPHTLRLAPRLVPAVEATVLTYRWPDLPPRARTPADRVVGDGIH
ncbi:MAG TPA: hypothetical protein VHL09_10070 [Dehalococcoidia bacterium]|nr:hypothetical protein [Dehalococcoidia bacterium]